MNTPNRIETEINTTRSLWMAGMPGPPPEDPTSYSVGAELKVLQVDPQALRSAMKRQFMSCLIPCFCCLPVWIACGVPCMIFCGSDETYEEFAQGRSLILTEKALIYRIQAGALQAPSTKWCCASERIAQPVEFHIFLDEQFALSESVETHSCFTARTLAISAKGQVLARMDFSKDLDQFVAAVKEQASKAQLGDVDFAARQVHSLVLEYYAFIANQGIPTRVVRSGSDTRTEVDKSQIQFQARLFYTTLMDRITAVQSNNVPMAAPVHMDMSRDAGIVDQRNQVRMMSVVEVQNMLRELGLYDQYSALFEKKNVDGSLLSVMDDSALQEIGVTSSLDRKAIMAWVIRRQNAGTMTLV